MSTKIIPAGSGWDLLEACWNIEHGTIDRGRADCWDPVIAWAIRIVHRTADDSEFYQVAPITLERDDTNEDFIVRRPNGVLVLAGRQQFKDLDEAYDYLECECAAQERRRAGREAGNAKARDGVE
jgi:hypothetical protein